MCVSVCVCVWAGSLLYELVFIQFVLITDGRSLIVGGPFIEPGLPLQAFYYAEATIASLICVSSHTEVHLHVVCMSVWTAGVIHTLGHTKGKQIRHPPLVFAVLNASTDRTAVRAEPSFVHAFKPSLTCTDSLHL